MPALPAASSLSGGGIASRRSDPLFQALHPERFGGLLEQVVMRRFPRGATLSTQDEPTSRFYVMLAGWARRSRIGADGSEAELFSSLTWDDHRRGDGRG